MTSDSFSSLFVDGFGRRRISRRSAWAAVVLAVVSTVITIGPWGVYRIPRVGDGGEYYAMYLAFTVAHRPYVTARSMAAYRDLYARGAIRNLPAPETLFRTDSRLRVGQTADYHHFWAYPGGATLLSVFDLVLPFSLGPTGWFLVLHALALFAALYVAWWHYGARGAVTVLTIIVVSPALWFVDKVHFEFVSFCLQLLGITLILRRRSLDAALPFALVATQIPVFSLLVLFLIGLHFRRTLPRFPRSGEIFRMGAAGAILALHPGYYLWRHGVITPQFKTGLAATAYDPSNALLWFIEPDIGLFAAWPLGLAIIVAAVVAARRVERSDIDLGGWLWFAGLEIVALSLASAASANFNHGATIIVSRYAAWFLPLFFPPLLLVLRLPWPGGPRRALVTIPLGAYVVVNAYIFHPFQDESYLRPTRFSALLQETFPHVYHPYREIFSERYSQREAPRLQGIAVVSTRNCRKMIVDVRHLPGAKPASGQIAGCRRAIDEGALLADLRRRLDAGESIDAGDGWRYVIFEPDAVARWERSAIRRAQPE